MIDKLKECLAVCKEAIWIKTSQEKETMITTINTLLDQDIDEIYTWSILKAVEKEKTK